MSSINFAGQSIVSGMGTPYSKKQDTPISGVFPSKYYNGMKSTSCQINLYAQTPNNVRQSESCENSLQRHHPASARLLPSNSQGQLSDIPIQMVNHQNQSSHRSQQHNSYNNNLQRPPRQPSENGHKYKLRQFVDMKQFSKQSIDESTLMNLQNNDFTTFTIPANNNSTNDQTTFLQYQSLTTDSTPVQKDNNNNNNFNQSNINKTIQLSMNLIDHYTPISQRLNTSNLSSNLDSIKQNGYLSSRDRLAMMSFASARENNPNNKYPLNSNDLAVRYDLGQKEVAMSTLNSQQEQIQSKQQDNCNNSSPVGTPKKKDIPYTDKRNFSQIILDEEIQAKIAEIEEDKRMYQELLQLSPLPKSRDTGNNTTTKDGTFSGFIQLEQCVQDKENTRTSISSPSKTSAKTRNRSNLSCNGKSNNSSSTNISTFSKNYKNICHIVDEAKHFKDSMKVSEAMLTTTITQNILPRKLGIVSKKDETSSEQSSIYENKILPASLSAIPAGSSSKIQVSKESQILKGVIDSSFENELDKIRDFEQSGSMSIKTARNYSKQDSYQTMKEINFTDSCKSSRTATNISSKDRNNQNNTHGSMSLYDRSNSVVLGRTNNKIGGKYIGGDMHTNGIAEEYKITFKDSDEVANYLQKNYLTKEENKSSKLKLNLSRLHIAKTYSTMLSKALKHPDFDTLHYLNLSNNFLSGTALQEISRNLPQQLKKLDLSHNFLTSKDSESLCYVLNHKNYAHLNTVNLSHNLFGDAGFKLIYQGIAKNTSLLNLNLSHNKLTDSIGMDLHHILITNTALQELYLGWNKFTSKTGIILAKGLNNNFNIKVLDLSHNSLGQNPSLSCGRKILQSCARIESGLIHLDFSYNLFTKSECLEIAATLSANQKLLGFHFEGNEMHAIVDSRGFLYFPDESQILQKHVSTHTLMRRDIHSVKFLGINKLQNFNCNATDNCWLCDGWEEIEFELRDNQGEYFLGDPAFLHLDFEDFRPTYMDKDPNDPNRYFLRRMCPPNRRILFFFTNPMTEILFESMEYDRTYFHMHEQNLNFYEEDDDEDNNILNNMNNSSSSSSVNMPNDASQQQQQNHFIHNLQRSKQRKFNVKYLDGTIQEYLVPTTVNFIATKAHKNVHKKKGEYDIHIQSQPRPTETYFKINFTNQWHRPISLFSSYQADTPEVELRCFEEDWNNSKAQLVVQSNYKNPDIETCKKLLIEKFPRLRCVYRYLSCFGLVNDYFFVTLQPFTLFATQSKIVDGNLLKMRDLECIFIAASSKALKAKSLRMPDKALTRPEFLEAIARLAVDKYIRNKVAKSPAEAVQMFLDNPHFQAHINDYEDPQLWRDIRYWNKQCDGVLKKYLNFIKSLWNEYADSRKVEKRTSTLTNMKSMSLKEFWDISIEFELKDKLLSDREINMSFNLALMSIPDEAVSEKYMVMSFVEFLEGLARMAEFKSRTPVGERDDAYVSYEREQIRLEYKIESLLEAMSIKYETVIKKKKKDKLFSTQNNNSKDKNGQKLQALKSRRSFIQFSVTDSQKTGGVNQNSNENNNNNQPGNKLVGAVNKLMSQISNSKYKQIGNENNNTGNNMTESTSSYNNNNNNSSSSIRSNNDFSKAPSRFLDRIDSLNDEFEEDNSFHQQNSGIVSLHDLEDQTN